MTSDVVINSCTTCPALPVNATIRRITINSGGKLDIGAYILIASTSASLSSAVLESSGGSLKTINFLKLENSVLNGNMTLEKTAGGGANVLNGGNLFNQATNLINSSASNLTIGNITKDFFMSDLTLTNTGTAGIFVAQNGAGHQFKGNIILNKPTGAGIYFCEGITATAELADTKTISIGSGGFPSGELRIKRFVQTGSTAQALTLTGTAVLRIATGAIFNGSVAFKAPQLYLDGGSYFGKVNLEKTGAINNTSAGGNVFRQPIILTNSGTGPFILGNAFPDSVSASLTVNNTGGSYTTLASNTKGNWLGGKVTLNNELGYIYLSNSSVSEATFVDSVWINNRSANAVIIANAANSQVSFKGFLSVRNLLNANAASNNQIYLGNAGICRMNGLVSLSNTSQGATSGIIIGSNAASRDTLTSTGQLEIGAEGFARGQLVIKNLAYLNPMPIVLNLSSDALPDANNALLSVGTNCSFNGRVDFTSPQFSLNSALYLHGGIFTKTGIGSNSGGGNVYSEKAVFNLRGNAPWDIALTLGDRFKGEAEFNNFSTQLLRIGGASNGTIFEKKTIFNNISSGSFTIAQNNASRVQFLDTVFIHQQSSNPVQLASQVGSIVEFTKAVWFDGVGIGAVNAPNAGIAIYKGDIVLNRKVVFGVTATGEVKLVENQPQLIYKTVNSSIPITTFQKLTIDKSSGQVTCQLPLTISTNLLLKRGIIEIGVTLPNVLSFTRTATVTGGNDYSFVKGVMNKTGNTSFTFPFGDKNQYRPIKTGNLYTTGTTLAANTVSLTANYFGTKQTQGDLRSDERLSLSPCEYWSLSSSVKVKSKISLRNKSACNPNQLVDIQSPTSLRVARFLTPVLPPQVSKWQSEVTVSEGDTVISTGGDIPDLNVTQYFTMGYWNQLTINTSRMALADFKLSGINGLPFNRTFISGTDSSQIHISPTVGNAKDTLIIEVLGNSSRHIQPLTLFFQTQNQLVLSPLTPVQVNRNGDIKNLLSDFYQISDDLYLGKILNFYQEVQPTASLKLLTNLGEGLLLSDTLVISGLRNLKATLNIFDSNTNIIFTVSKNHQGDTITWIPASPPMPGTYKFTLAIDNENNINVPQTYAGQFIQK